MTGLRISKKIGHKYYDLQTWVIRTTGRWSASFKRSIPSELEQVAIRSSYIYQITHSITRIDL